MANFKITFVLFVFVLVQAGYCMPQGFFSQGFSIPKLVSWNNNEQSLAILPNVKVASPIKSSHFNVFGKKNTDDKKNKIDQQIKLEQINGAQSGQNFPSFTNPRETELKNSIPEQKNNKPEQIYNKPEQQNNIAEQNNYIQGVQLPHDQLLVSKFGDVSDNAPNNQNGDSKVTTETLSETTTDSYETTTFDDEPLNRASPQLVASLLG